MYLYTIATDLHRLQVDLAKKIGPGRAVQFASISFGKTPTSALAGAGAWTKIENDCCVHDIGSKSQGLSSSPVQHVVWISEDNFF